MLACMRILRAYPHADVVVRVLFARVPTRDLWSRTFFIAWQEHAHLEIYTLYGSADWFLALRHVSIMSILPCKGQKVASSLLVND